MTAALVAAIAVSLAVVGVIGVVLQMVVPMLPGSIAVAAGLLVWTLGAHPAYRWWLLGAGLAVIAAGMLAGSLLTARRLGRREMPRWPMLVAGAGGLVGLVLIPGVGAVVGFLGTLVAVEWLRVKNFRAALGTTWEALRAIGVGLAIEFVCAVAVTSALLVSVTRTVG